MLLHRSAPGVVQSTGPAPFSDTMAFMFKSLCWHLAAFALGAFVAHSPAAHAADFYTEDLRIPIAAAGPRGLEAAGCGKISAGANQPWHAARLR
jgi:hypothetical protein